MNIEIWRRIPHLPHYEISEHGLIRRCVHGRTRPIGHIVKGCMSCGYFRAKLMLPDGSKRLFPIHRLVAETFIGPQPSPKHEVAHFDGIGTNNHFSNLRWATRAENAADRIRHGRNFFTGESNPKAKLTPDIVRQIRAEYRPGYGNKAKLRQKYGIGTTSLDRLLDGRNWRHVGP